MARARKKEPEAHARNGETVTTTSPDVFDQAIADREAAARQQHAAVLAHQLSESNRSKPEQPPTTEHHGHAQRHASSGHGHAAAVEPRKFTPPADPFGFENVKAGENRVQLLKSEGHGAWLIRFAHNPNQDPGPNGETYSKENPHPVLKMLREEGYRWGFDNGDSKGGWGKPFNGDAYGADHIEARKVLQKAADMIGHKVDQGRIPD